MDVMKYIGRKIIEKSEDIAKKILEKQSEKYEGTIQIDITAEEVLELQRNLIELYGECLSEESDQACKKIGSWAKSTGEYAVRLGSPLDPSLDETRYYRQFIALLIEEEAQAGRITYEDAFKALFSLNTLVDEAVYSFSLAFVKHHTNQIEQSQQALFELLVPVVPVTDTVAVLPVIGEIDTYRAQHLLQLALKRSSDYNLEYLIIDLSGVAIIDTAVAQEIFKIIDSLKLLGVKILLTGIRPEIAQTMVTLGIDIDRRIISASLKTALYSIGFRAPK